MRRTRPQGSRPLYTLVLVITPVAGFAATFFGLCLVECTALPWLTLILGPFVALVCTVAVGLIGGKSR